MFTEKDIEQIIASGQTVDSVQCQINYFKCGFPALQILRPVTVRDGLVRLSEKDVDFFLNVFEQEKNKLDLLKFVPASGAATRMFKSLIRAKNEGFFDQTVTDFFQKIEAFAFYPDLKSVMCSDNLDFQYILNFILTDVGLNFQNIPKGLLKFHSYSDGCRTPVEEHMVEGALYAESNGNVKLHFTIAPEFESNFRDLIDSILVKYQKKFNVNYQISFSVQKASTNTVAVNLDNTPFRLSDGNLLFRPAGHGALLENINNINADIIFIKNIDNVVPEGFVSSTVLYKKALAGILVSARNRVYDLISRLQNDDFDDLTIDAARDLLLNELSVICPLDFLNFSKEIKRRYLIDKLNRPLRVCGLVTKTGDSGGGPFWVAGPDGSSSIQLVETSQMDLDDPRVASMLTESTHFNPVFLVCSVKNHKGEKFNLFDFRDPLTGFVSFKSYEGVDLKTQELPGLWNGSMADWNTIFVEVPVDVFNPVKSVNDLLRDRHLCI